MYPLQWSYLTSFFEWLTFKIWKENTCDDKLRTFINNIEHSKQITKSEERIPLSEDEFQRPKARICTGDEIQEPAAKSRRSNGEPEANGDVGGPQDGPGFNR